MKKIMIGILSMGIIILFHASGNAEIAFHKSTTDFSVHGIYEILESNYISMTECENLDFQKIAERVYKELKAYGKGFMTTASDCNGLAIEFHNMGTPFLTVIKRQKK